MQTEDSPNDNPETSKQVLLDEIAFLRQKLAKSSSATEQWQKQLHAISESLLLGFWEWDEIQDRATFYSESMSKIYGISQEELNTRYFTNAQFHPIIHPDDLEYYKLHTDNAVSHFDENNTHKFDYRIILPGGEVRYIKEVAFADIDQDGAITRSYGVVQDITNFRETSSALKQSEKRFSSLFDQLPVGVQEEDYSSIKRVVDKLQYKGIEDIEEYLIDHPKILREMVSGTKITAVNQALLDMHEAPSRQVFFESEANIDDWWDADWVEFYAREIHALALGKRYYEAERIDSRVDGTFFETRSITTLVKGHEDDWKRVITIHEDITDRKKSELALLEAKILAEKASAAKSEFVSSMSHELRTPLNAILGFSQLFEYDENLSDHQRSNAIEINQAGKHLLVLVDEILDLSRIEAGEIEVSMEPVALLDIITNSFSWIEKLAEKRNVSIEYDRTAFANIIVKGDATRLKQVFLNLFTNAVKYNVEGGRVSLKIDNNHEDIIRVGVSDTGPGISDEKLEDLFQPFNRLGAEFSSTEGTGIGLVITRQLIELMDGELQVETESGKGSTFWVELASVNQAEIDYIQDITENRKIESRPAIRMNQPYILVAEDNMINQELMAAQMELLDYQVEYASNGAEALEKWQSGKYYVLLTDIRMPVMDGYELIREIRAIDITGTHPVSIVAITANAMASDREKCIEAGADDVIAKPVELEELRKALEKWVPREKSSELTNKADEESKVAGSAKVIDLEVLQQSVGDKPKTHRNLLKSFIRSLPEAVGDIEDAFAWRNHEKLAEAAHKLKSSARSMGALKLGNLCQRLETAGRNKEWSELEATMPQMLVEDEQVRQFINNLFDLDVVPDTKAENKLPEEDTTVPEVDINVLLVDDDFIMHRVTTTILNDLGIKKVLNALSGPKALEIITDNPDEIDLIICDLNMPGMDGVEFMRHLAERHYSNSLILTSGEDIRILKTVEKLAIEHELHVLGVMEKPITASKLNELLETFDRIKSEGTMIMADVCSLDELIDALNNDELDVFFQPQVDLKTKKVVGVEALVRWNQPKLGLIRPDAFISLAEENGLINQLTQIVCEKSIQYARLLQPLESDLNIAINISVDALSDLDWPDAISGLIDEAGLEHSRITFEITESRLMEHISVALDILSRLSLKRFNLSIDDFGTGYSSMEQLQRIPFSELKIDRAFVNGAAEDASARAILESSVLLAKKLNMKIIAEGVETQKDWDLLKALEVDQVQGYFVSKPLQFDRFVEWLRDWQQTH